MEIFCVFYDIITIHNTTIITKKYGQKYSTKTKTNTNTKTSTSTKAITSTKASTSTSTSATACYDTSSKSDASTTTANKPFELGWGSSRGLFGAPLPLNRCLATNAMLPKRGWLSVVVE